MIQSQVHVPPRAEQRGGIQPVVSLKANGRERADVGVGEPVTFVAEISVQPGTYFPVLRATSQRDGDSKTPYARVQKLARVRVVVK